jgi:death-on-curing protein
VTAHLTADEVLHIASRVLGTTPGVRDLGLIESAVARPRATVLGEDAYPTLHAKAAALLHSLVQNHALVDGNKRLGWASLTVFYGLNGHRLTASNDQAYELVVEIASGQLAEVDLIAARLEPLTKAV